MSDGKTRDWGALIREQLSSGKSQVAYCRERGVSLATFQYHKGKGTHVKREQAQKFVSIVGGEAEDRIEVKYGADVQVYFPVETSLERLSELVRCLSSK